MKVRIGIGAGASSGPDAPGRTFDAIAFDAFVSDVDALGFDSIWLPEVLTAPTLDPLVALAFAAARDRRVKLGTTVVLPGQNAVRLGKALATLDVLSGGRLLVTFVAGLHRTPEISALGVVPGDRGRLMDELLPLLRLLWSGEQVTHHGEAASFEDVQLAPVPLQQPLELWTGGTSRAALVRCGLFADGWLPSACTPDEVAEGREVIDEIAGGAGRSISPEHFGVSLAYSHAPLTPRERQALATRRAGEAVNDVVPVGIGALAELIERFVDVGFSKFVVRPLHVPASWRAELEALAAGIGGLQT